MLRSWLVIRSLQAMVAVILAAHVLVILDDNGLVADDSELAQAADSFRDIADGESPVDIETPKSLQGFFDGVGRIAGGFGEVTDALDG
ncbi:MAG: hypothetical protein AAGA59_19215 [Actinomycetota bacterium]